MQRIIIKHVSGSKANQVDTFAVDQCQTLTLGRGSAQTIKYDPDWDDTVSREHATISWGVDEDNRFLLTDLDSSNGTYVNKRRIHGTVCLRPGDTIQLGPGGPEFHFDVDPRPDLFILPQPELEDVLFRPTKEMSARNGSRKDAEPVKSALGRETVERMIGGYYRKSRRNLVLFATLVVSLIMMVTGVLLYRDFFIERQLHQTRREMTQTIQAPVKIREEMIQRGTPNDPVLSPAEIVASYGPATVMIEMGWTLIHAESDAQVYHRYEGGGQYPAYVQWQGKYRPWLYIDDEHTNGIPIGGEEQGSGFVVTNSGYMLTSRHLVASWYAPYSHFPLLAQSVFFDADPETGLIQWHDNASPITDASTLQGRQQHLAHWIPAQEGILVKTKIVNGKRTYYVVPGRKFAGRIYKLDVIFPKNKLRTPAQLASTSTKHDVALLKTQMPNALPKVTMYNRYQNAIPGTPVTVLGYPNDLSDGDRFQTSTETFQASKTAGDISGLSVTPGVIGQIIRGEILELRIEGGHRSQRVDKSFHLPIRPIDQGSRGSPVFDQRGRVIGILSYDIEDHIQTNTVVPIQFGMDIMGVTSDLN